MVVANIMNLSGIEPKSVYRWFMEMYVDSSDWVMAQAGHNQSKAADWLGLNRNTLRKKLDEHGMLKASSR
jgi:DNA-binding protein Fis